MIPKLIYNFQEINNVEMECYINFQKNENSIEIIFI